MLNEIKTVFGGKTIKLKLFFFLMLFSTCLFAQQQNRNWHFGNNAGINFPVSGLPTALANSQINTMEGCASISKDDGTLLFYTDGVTVWDKNNTIMTGGTGLLGDNSSTQSSVIVPRSSNTYYIFTTPVIGSSNGLRYTIVDFTNPSYPDGYVVVSPITKNVAMTSPPTIVVYEKIAVHKKPDCTGYWVVAHEAATNKFLVYSATSSGVSAATIYAVGLAPPYLTNPTFTTTWSFNPLFGNSYGYLKFSPDGRQLAMALSGDNTVEIYYFDPLTGVITVRCTLKDPKYLNGVYGVEFSPSFDLTRLSNTPTEGNYLYTTAFGDNTTGHILSQFDLTLPTYSDIVSERITISSYPTTGVAYTGFGALQLGPDSKIYVARGGKNFLSCINNPDVEGIGCNYTEDAIDLDGKTCRLGLPNLVSNIDACPVTQLDPCCPPWNKDLLSDMMFYEGSGSFPSPYTLHFKPTALFNSLMHSYLLLLNSVNSSIIEIIINWRLSSQGTSSLPSSGYGSAVGPQVFTVWNVTDVFPYNPNVSIPGFFNETNPHPMEVGTWYKIHTGIYLNNDRKYFPDDCAINDVDFLILYKKTSTSPLLEFSFDGNTINKTVQIK